MLNILVSDIVQIFGFQYHLKKNCGINQVITYFGYELDSTLMKCTFRKEKKFKTFNLHLNKTSLTLKQVHLLIYLLNFACNVVMPGRAFLKKFIDLTIGIIKEYYRIRMTKQVEEDLAVWYNFLTFF